MKNLRITKVKTSNMLSPLMIPILVNINKITILKKKTNKSIILCKDKNKKVHDKYIKFQNELYCATCCKSQSYI